MKYSGKYLNELIFPLGGMGTGSVSLAGNGAFVDWEIFNRPNKGSLNHFTCFAIRAEYPDGRSTTRVLQGDHTRDLMGTYSKVDFSGYGYGPSNGTMAGFPHFRKVSFDGSFPVATLTFEDEAFPAKVVMKAFNPFIPLNADDSSLPAAFFDVAVHSREDGVKYLLVFSVHNPFGASENIRVLQDRCTAVTLRYAGKTPDDRDYAEMTAAVDCMDGVCQEYWYRGQWQDKISTFWHELTHGQLPPRHYEEAGQGDLCSVGAQAEIGAKQRRRFRFVLSWYAPNQYCYWDPCKDENGSDVLWKNYYATLFEDSAAVCRYALDNWDRLSRHTDRFRRSLHTSTLDPAIIEAVSSTLSVLKSPTVLRLEDGTFYGWEGVHEKAGSCPGTCTHVWSYAYALCFLFPDMERSLRRTEFERSTDERGWMQFRSSLPVGRERAGFHPCVDGQMATVVKMYRDWKLTGDDEWLKDNWEHIKRILEFAWDERNPYEWDRNKDGVLEGRQHHTLDMELFGPSAWLEGMYLAALKAASRMADAMGETDKRDEYAALFEKGYQWTKDNLFNGRYFIHKIDLTDRTPAEHFSCLSYWNEEKGQLKYQIGDGCEIDQMLGQWHAAISGLGDIFDKDQRRTALQSMMQNNFKPSLRGFANMWRVFALNDEAGTVICDYPEGAEKPVIPIPYCEECMTGFEYAFAGLLASEGFAQECVQVVRAIRGRYDGDKRNPFNEIECGSNYARPMASFALLPIFSGFTFDLPGRSVGFAPIQAGDFRCLFSVGTGWGDYIRTGKDHCIALQQGSLTLSSVRLPDAGSIRRLVIDGREVPFTCEGDVLRFEETCIRRAWKAFA